MDMDSMLTPLATSESTRSLCNPALESDPVLSSDPLGALPTRIEKAAGEAGPASCSGLQSNVVVFNQIDYLGSSHIADANDEPEMLRLMSILNDDDHARHVCVALHVPMCRNGRLILVDEAGTGAVTVSAESTSTDKSPSSVDVDSGLSVGSDGQLSMGTNEDTDQPACSSTPISAFHLYRVGRILVCFAGAFKSPTDASLTRHSTDSFLGSSTNLTLAGPAPSEFDFQFEAQLELKEDDGKKTWPVCPQERNCFKIRRSRQRKILLVLRQTGGTRPLPVMKCFGLLLAAGRNVRQTDMHLLDMQSMCRGQDHRSYMIEAMWDPNGVQFEVLNTETPRDTRVFMTIAADIVLAGIGDPVRFTVECKARIYHQHERFWYIIRKPVVEQYFLTIKPIDNRSPASDSQFEVAQFESATQRDYKTHNNGRVRLNARYTQFKDMRHNGGVGSPSTATQLIHPCADDESDGDEPLLSGSGAVNTVTSDEVMSQWQTVVDAWRLDPSVRPDGVSALVCAGVPDSLRPQVWLLLTGASEAECADLAANYAQLVENECAQEQCIQRDIHRTFPAHEHFKQADGTGQRALYRLSKAYALCDTEVGYCQGLSFLAASLLLHLPEEKAFVVLVKIMYDYGLRDLFKHGFDTLHLRFYQLDRLIEDYIVDLYQHLFEQRIETHMFASQWFLTLFTAKFPLSMVYRIIDLFLTEGMNTIFHISLALLRASRTELLQLDFEAALKYFRVVLPRKYRTEAAAQELINQAVKLKMSHKRLAKYALEYAAVKQQEVETTDPIERLERERNRLKDTILRLERENDDLAHELVTSKIQLRSNLDAAEDNVECLQTQVERHTRANNDLTDENRQLHEEYEKVKEMCRREMSRLENEWERSRTIIVNYKQICNDLSTRLEAEQTQSRVMQQKVLAVICSSTGCECSSKLCARDPVTNSITGLLCTATAGSPVSPTASHSSFDMLPTGDQQVRALELQLAQTKLALVEAECKCQDLTHQLAEADHQQQQLSSSMVKSQSREWFKKAISSATVAMKQRQHPSNNVDSHHSTDKKEAGSSGVQC